MKESDFIEQNKKKWADFENQLSSNQSRPDRISQQYIETIDDLSFARTHYTNRLVRSYLNGVAQILSLKIYRSQRQYSKGFKKFWAKDLPLVMYEARKQFLLSFLLLAISMGIGILSSMHDPEFAAFILGENYVQETLANIENGDPMAIYKSSGQTQMLLYITTNNILVSVWTYLNSFFLGVGTLIMMVRTGVMVGVFQYFFIERGLFFESFLTIWQHGVVEISCIVLAGAAGLVLAKGILFPKTHSRINAFRYAGRKSLIIMLGLMPLLVYSGAIEAIVTRYTEIHWVVRLSAILLTLAFVIIYFVIYPRKVTAKYNVEDEMDLYLQPMQPFTFTYFTIEKNVSIVWKSLGLLHLYRKPFIISTLLLSVMGVFLMIDVDVNFEFFRRSYNVPSIYNHFNTGGSFKMSLTNGIIVMTAIFIANTFLRKNVTKDTDFALNLRAFIGRLLIPALISAVIIVSLNYNIWLVVILIAVLPMIGVFCTNSWIGSGSFIQSFQATSKLMGKGYSKTLLIVLIHLLVLALMILMIESLLLDLAMELLEGFAGFDPISISAIRQIASISVELSILFFCFVSMFLSIGLSHFSLVEVNHASSLRKNISELFPSADLDQKASSGLLSSKKLSTE